MAYITSLTLLIIIFSLILWKLKRKWISVDVEKPNDMEEVLFTHIKIKRMDGTLMKPSVSSGYYRDGYFYSWVDPRDRRKATHWMRLPIPPKNTTNWYENILSKIKFK